MHPDLRSRDNSTGTIGNGGVAASAAPLGSAVNASTAYLEHEWHLSVGSSVRSALRHMRTCEVLMLEQIFFFTQHTTGHVRPCL